MASASAPTLTDTMALSLLKNIRESISSGCIPDLGAAQTEIDVVIAQLNDRQPEHGESSSMGDVIPKLSLELESLSEKIVKCEALLTGFESQAKFLTEELARVVSGTEACGQLADQQEKENSTTETSVSTVSPPSVAPAPLSADLSVIPQPAPSMNATVSFPGGPRTVTIHPPGTSGYRQVIRDDQGNIILDFRRTKPLRREGAFRGPLETVDWGALTRVCGRGPDPPAASATPPSPRWPNPADPPLRPPSARPSDLIARQRQLSTCVQTDAFGRVLPPEHLGHARSPSLPTGMSSSSVLVASSQDVLVCLRTDQESTSPTPMPSSPLDGRGKKRTWNSADGEADASQTEATTLTTPTPAKREARLMKRKKLRRTMSDKALSPNGSQVDLARTV